MRYVVVTGVVVALAASGAFAAGLGASGGDRKPRLVIASERPLVVVGRGFRTGERVSLTASIGSQDVRRSLAADSQGRFIARFRTGPVCGPIYVQATGRRGSRASARRHVIPPPCGIDPAPGLELER